MLRVNAAIFKQKWFMVLLAILLSILIMGTFFLAFGIIKGVRSTKEQASIQKVTPGTKNADEEKKDEETGSVLNISGLTVKDIDKIVAETKSAVGPQDQSQLTQAQLLLDMVKGRAELEKKEVDLQINIDGSGKITKMIVEIPDCQENPEDIKQLGDLTTAYSEFDIEILKSPSDIDNTMKIMIAPK